MQILSNKLLTMLLVAGLICAPIQSAFALALASASLPCAQVVSKTVSGPQSAGDSMTCCDCHGKKTCDSDVSSCMHCFSCGTCGQSAVAVFTSAFLNNRTDYHSYDNQQIVPLQSIILPPHFRPPQFS